MSMSIVHHVLGKSQTQGSARTLLLTLAIHANDCCGVAWVSDTTLRHEVNVSRQRIHELKNIVEATGELIIVERPGYTNLYFVAWQGHPVGGQGSYRAAPGSTHEPGCPLRRRVPVTKGEVSGESDTQGSGGSDTPCQEALTQKTRDNDTENEAKPVSLSFEDGPRGPEESETLPPERHPPRRIRLTPGSKAYLLLYGEAEHTATSKAFMAVPQHQQPAETRQHSPVTEGSCPSRKPEAIDILDFFRSCPHPSSMHLDSFHRSS
jgi:hypothetical protein